MGKILILFSILSIIYTPFGYGKCTPSKDISTLENKYLYSEGCHKVFGKIVKDNKDLKEINKTYEELLGIKDQRLDLQKERVEMWKNSAEQLEKTNQQLQKDRQRDNYLHFLAGAGVVILSIWAGSKVTK